MIKTKWGQSSPYNLFTPTAEGAKQSLVGCFGVAFGQALNYYQYPKRGMGTATYSIGAPDNRFPVDRTFDTNYDWDAMTTFNGKVYSPRSEAAPAVSRLLADVGIAVRVRFSEDNSAATTDRPSTFSKFRFHMVMPDVVQNRRATFQGTDDDWNAMIISEIAAGRPVIITGSDEVNADGAGHAFILDGMRSDGKVHVNWGWNGDGNGYYDLNDLKVFNRYSFTDGMYAYTNITPNIVPEGRACNGKYGRRCQNGLLCVSRDDLSTVLNERLSDDQGVCVSPPPTDDGHNGDDEEPEPVTPTDADAPETTNVEEEAGAESGTLSLKSIDVAKNEWKVFGPFSTIEDVVVTMAGTGDADLFVKRGGVPSKSSYDCRSLGYTSDEKCTVSGKGDFYVGVIGFKPAKIDLIIETTKSFVDF